MFECAVLSFIHILVLFCAAIICALHVLEHRCEAGISDLSI